MAFPKDLLARLGTGWASGLQDTMGEFQLEVWLESAGKLPKATATAAAQGWGGDRMALVTKGDRAGVVIDTAGTARPMPRSSRRRPSPRSMPSAGHGALIAIEGSDRVTVFVATDDATISALAGALGLAG